MAEVAGIMGAKKTSEVVSLSCLSFYADTFMSSDSFGLCETLIQVP